ncbi:MAG: hypothetical protein UR11_C0001G0222 [Candidatus Woesebacteria bacterium GW2011_GWC1_30_29]|uniref:Glycosyltransferase RgtA/B/C/D-like domain-containing protein n=1 Tax=Candidatus Woesebacteria bacterium GW2011_GWC2_31_9 TaxID=1618586 RepID=A0A0G0AZI6_9BACT|nr:MAG: hypothetical protein UR11_C0001G0222 [Candidatus Woesebacteria bacterium GW2011_GWC1_30_29]KKP25500.1 MAG: hypothetical protein UR13_C0008G0016 [Candidatus Woesebacteria bacterium GW2011_GWD1_31_12]KKP27510.1 MAG: hypothetical protein UR16_C0003G0170 [Candidatus Woesebacteria bacterium GW2011_GWB1_31_29]KKP31970.1 MAG: hypothetical protein UR21_C0003G0003 [Candidatus Woesebacteria bacterium GW2011_GWC2_31_9]KKP33877.1 MAG: hypothetical protein UR24_C0002G0172 [Candidatus Woesebacteria b
MLELYSMNRIKKIIAKIDTPLWLEILFAVLLILRIPSFFEPYYYGDEMIYLTLGEGVRQGVPLYLGLHDNKPPLLYLTAAVAGNLFFFKVILAFWSLITVYGFWKLISSIFPEKKTLHKISTIIFGLLTTLPLLEGNTVNAELFMIGPIIFAFWILLTKKNNFKNVFISGGLISIAALFKIPAAFDILGIVAFWAIFVKKDTFFEFIKKCIYLSLGFIVPIGLTFIWYYFAGALKVYLVAAFLQNFGYVSSWRPTDIAKPFLVKNAPLLIRAGIFVLGIGVLFISKKKFSKNFIFVSAWLLATLFAVTLSERPYPHYFVQSIAPVSILLGMLITLKTIEQSLVVIPLTLVFFVPFYYKFWYYPTSTYYLRFIDFVSGKITKDVYFSKFSPNVNMNYKLADFLIKSSNKDDKIFIWSNDAPAIYSLSRRLPPTKYVADYHFLDFSNKEYVFDVLSKNKPKFIIITPNSFRFPELSDFVQKNYYLISEVDSSQIWLYIKK